MFTLNRTYPVPARSPDHPAQPVRQVVEPSGGITSRVSQRSAATRRKSEAEHGDFQTVFMQALAKNSP